MLLVPGRFGPGRVLVDTGGAEFPPSPPPRPPVILFDGLVCLGTAGFAGTALQGKESIHGRTRCRQPWHWGASGTHVRGRLFVGGP